MSIIFNDLIVAVIVVGLVFFIDYVYVLWTNRKIRNEIARNREQVFRERNIK